MIARTENLVSTLQQWLEGNPARHLDRFQKGQLTALGQYYCTGCRKILPLEEFAEDDKKSTGLSSYCSHCNASTGLPHEFLPPDGVEEPGALSDFFQDKLAEAVRKGARRVPRALANVVREKFSDRVAYCSSCRRFHPVEEPMVGVLR